MSGNRSRRKGIAGENEVLGILRDRLGDNSIQRNLDQSREGGGDCAVLVGGMLLEVKRFGKRARLHEAVLQAERAASDSLHAHYDRCASTDDYDPKAEPVPVVAYRLDGDRWRFLVDCDVTDFCLLVREGVFND